MNEFIFTVGASAVGFFLARVVGGWIDGKVHGWAKEEEQRDADLSTIKSIITDLRSLASNYWARDHSPEDKKDEGEIIGLLRYVRERLINGFGFAAMSA